MTFTAASEGKWGAQIRIKIDQENGSKEIADKVGVPSSADLFNLEVQVGPQHERFLNLTVKESSRRVDRILATQSNLIRYDGFDPANPPVLSPGLDVISSAETEVNKAKQNCDAKERELDSWDKALEVAKKDDPQEAKQETKDVKNARDNAASELDAAKRQISEAEDKLKSERNIAIKVSDGAHLEAENILPVGGLANKKGLYALEQADLFNLLCIPPYSPTDGINFDIDKSVLGEVASYCERRRAMLLIDSPSNWSGSEAKAFARTQFSSTGSDAFPGVASKNAAMFFPRLMQSNPFRDGHVEAFAPCGAVAGVIARTDTQRGVWKAPAGLEATIAGSLGLEVNLTDAENGELNPIGLNCLRTFPFAGSVVWGARTLRGADQLADEWKYVPVRRTALFIEESLYRGTKWVVHQPNDEPLWAQIRLNVGAFMNDLFRQGAFQGQTPRDAYFVKCSSETTTPNDINKGVVNIHVGFAPLKPAEFVVIQLQQIAGQIQT
ncbi:phage tail sheath subtilisin-like domain-containing protein [Bradyrhizobium sp. JYMT SZCCT0180]|nr:phage tail sheath subtilisin-like domain-containing protein [Bradyrhizobium sp. JYMT SZCCT0180]